MGGSINVSSHSYSKTSILLTPSQFISWFWPLAATPDRRSGWEFETNDFEGTWRSQEPTTYLLTLVLDPAVSWPPPDPDRITLPRIDPNSPQPYANVQQEIDDFNRRKTEEMRRITDSGIYRRKPFHNRYQRDEFAASESDESESQSGNDSDEGEESWRNAEGERLRDFGVDEEAEFYDEEDIPLGVLLQHRRQQQS
jgi:palmitoyltransferase